MASLQGNPGASYSHHRECYDMQKNPIKTRRQVVATRERLNSLMEAMALIIARRQMKRHWAAGHRAHLPSII
jgi:hypothetical protein